MKSPPPASEAMDPVLCHLQARGGGEMFSLLQDDHTKGWTRCCVGGRSFFLGGDKTITPKAELDGVCEGVPCS